MWIVCECCGSATKEIVHRAKLNGDLETFAVSDLRPPLMFSCSLRAILQASETHVNGLFVTKDLGAGKGFIPVPLVGRFEVHDNEDGCWQAVKRWSTAISTVVAQRNPVAFW